MEPLSTVDLTADLRELAYLASAGGGVEELLQNGLAWLERLTPYDLAAVFELQGGRLVVKASRGALASRKVRKHTLDLAEFPSIQAALSAGRARTFKEADHRDGDGDPFHGVVDLPDGHACMVVPLCTQQQCYGLMTLDRTRCEVFSRSVVNLVEIFGQLLTLALVNASQKDALSRLREQDQEHARLLEVEAGADEEGVLEQSAALSVRMVAQRARQVARTQTPVLIRGETGTGKEQLARAIHRWSGRETRPFVKMNCAAIPHALLESELFGHVRGGFTGATTNRAGRFQTANGGTLLLDEIGELPLDLQGKLLRVLQEGTFEPVGSDKTVKVDVRILAATHVDLEQAILDRRFREDLYYRLNVFPLTLPPLRERLEDLPALCASLLRQLEGRTARRGLRVSDDAVRALRQHGWPGNIRELANVLERAVILGTGKTVGPQDLDLAQARTPSTKATGSRVPVLCTLEDMERIHIRAVLTRTHGKVYGKDGAAAVLGMKPSTLQSRMKKLGLARVE